MSLQSKFFAYLGRLRWIKRWGLKRNVIDENVMEHSWQVATIAHALAIIENRFYDGALDVNRIATTALYHDVSEIITGDLPSPIKYHSADIRDAYKKIESQAELQMLNLLPQELQADFAPLLLHSQVNPEEAAIIKAADIISAYLKCQAELQAGNQEFSNAANDINSRVRDLKMPAVDYFMRTFVDSYLLTLDELLDEHDKRLKTTMSDNPAD